MIIKNLKQFLKLDLRMSSGKPVLKHNMTVMKISILH